MNFIARTLRFLFQEPGAPASVHGAMGLPIHRRAVAGGRRSRFSGVALAAALILPAIHLIAAPVKIELPAETGVFKPGPDAELANGQCLVCHSVEYVTTQPAFPRTFWASSVKKMREKYGAAIPEEQIEPLLDYLTKHYGIGTNTAPTTAQSATIVTTSPATTAAATPTVSAATVAVKYGCFGCHNPTVKIVGPAYKDIAAKYRNDADAPAKVSEQIHKGGSGKWGPVIMPPFPQVTEEETRVLADWILKQK